MSAQQLGNFVEVNVTIFGVALNAAGHEISGSPFLLRDKDVIKLNY